MKEEIRNTENTENKERRILNDEELEPVSGGAITIAIGTVPTLGQNNDMETNDVRGFTVFKLDIGGDV